MSDRWIALIDLPPERQQQIEAVLAPAGMECVNTDWDCRGDAPPVLLIAPFDRFEDNRGRCMWLAPGREASPIPVLLAAETPTAGSLQLQLDHDVFNVAPETLCGDPPGLARLLHGLLAPEAMFDIGRYVADPAIRKRFPVATLAEKHQIADEVAALVRPYTDSQRRVRDVYLIINELINNAFFHSFRNVEGEEKYSPRQFSALDEHDAVLVEVAAAENAIALAVEDNRGTLSPREVLNYMLRQTSGEGIYDSHGRGFYLIANLVNHLCICLTPGRRARVVAFTRTDVENPARTLSFFVTA